MNTTFTICHLDPLGQGVCKDYDQVTFIPKTLPGEKGEMRIIKRHKGVAFAVSTAITSPSPLRCSPSCLHFETCSGCHYLHTTYEQELQFKVKSLQFMLKAALQESPLIELIPSKQRLGYRNRLQLHYNIHQKKLGFMGEQGREILPIPQCQLPLIPIQECLKQLYKGNSWMNLIPEGHPPIGHLELYWKQQQVELHWNQHYAAGGFSQVNPQLNRQIPDILYKKREELFGELANPVILDLFGGDGNLSRPMPGNKWVVDLPSSKNIPDFFIPMDLYQRENLEVLYSKIGLADILLVNPPRSGFKFLSNYLDTFRPKALFYMSCKASTLIRDIKPILNIYTIESVFLIDFFPSTYHFETLVILKKKDRY